MLGAILSLKGTTYTLAVASMFGEAAGVAGVAGAASELPLWLSVSAASAVAAGLLLGSVREPPRLV